MKAIAFALLLALAACDSGPRPLPLPDKSAPVWSLNADRQQGTNDLVQPPSEVR